MRRASRGLLAVPSSETDVEGAVGMLVLAVVLSWAVCGGGGGGNAAADVDGGRSLTLLTLLLPLIVLLGFWGLGAGLEEVAFAPATADCECDVGACH